MIRVSTMSQHKLVTLKEVAALVDGELRSEDPTKLVQGACTLQNGRENAIAFFDASHSSDIESQLLATKAGLVLLSSEYAELCPVDCVVVPHPRMSFATIANFFADNQNEISYDIHKNVSIDESSDIDKCVSIASGVVIGKRTKIAAGVIIGPNCVIGDDCVIGKNSFLHANVTVYNNVSIGEQCIVHSACVLGSDGFSYEADAKGVWQKISQLGGVRIGNHVELGAACTIDCGSIDDTTIADGVKLDNQVHLAHNVQIGKNTIIAGYSAIAGSTVIGANCMFGGGARIPDHLNITDRVILLGDTSVSNSISEPGMYASAIPAAPVSKWRKMIARLRHLDDIVKRLIKIERELDEQR